MLALQGAITPHLAALRAVGASDAEFSIVEVRRPAQLETVDRLIIPGGESTALWRLLRHAKLWEPIGERARAGTLALFGTCAGAILLGREDPADPPPRWDIVSVTVERNAYGKQVDSFIGQVDYSIDAAGGGLSGESQSQNLSPSKQPPPEPPPTEPAEGVFIRAPRFLDPGPKTQLLAACAGEPVALRQGRVILATFHPELATDRRLHRLFLQL